MADLSDKTSTKPAAKSAAKLSDTTALATTPVASSTAATATPTQPLLTNGSTAGAPSLLAKVLKINDEEEEDGDGNGEDDNSTIQEDPAQAASSAPLDKLAAASARIEQLSEKLGKTKPAWEDPKNKEHFYCNHCRQYRPMDMFFKHNLKNQRRECRECNRKATRIRRALKRAAKLDAEFAAKVQSMGGYIPAPQVPVGQPQPQPQPQPQLQPQPQPQPQMAITTNTVPKTPAPVAVRKSSTTVVVPAPSAALVKPKPKPKPTLTMRIPSLAVRDTTVARALSAVATAPINKQEEAEEEEAESASMVYGDIEDGVVDLGSDEDMTAGIAQFYDTTEYLRQAVERCELPPPPLPPRQRPAVKLTRRKADAIFATTTHEPRRPNYGNGTAASSSSSSATPTSTPKGINKRSHAQANGVESLLAPAAKPTAAAVAATAVAAVDVPKTQLQITLTTACTMRQQAKFHVDVMEFVDTMRAAGTKFDIRLDVVSTPADATEDAQAKKARLRHTTIANEDQVEPVNSNNVVDDDPFNDDDFYGNLM